MDYFKPVPKYAKRDLEKDCFHICDENNNVMFDIDGADNHEAASSIIKAFALLEEAHKKYSIYDDKVGMSDEWFGELADSMRVNEWWKLKYPEDNFDD
jgi:hypothetical protein